MFTINATPSRLIPWRSIAIIGAGAAVTGALPMLPALALGATQGSIYSLLTAGLKPPKEHSDFQAWCCLVAYGASFALGTAALNATGWFSPVNIQMAVMLGATGVVALLGGMLVVSAIIAAAGYSYQPTPEFA